MPLEDISFCALDANRAHSLPRCLWDEHTPIREHLIYRTFTSCAQQGVPIYTSSDPMMLSLVTTANSEPGFFVFFQLYSFATEEKVKAASFILSVLSHSFLYSLCVELADNLLERVLGFVLRWLGLVASAFLYPWINLLVASTTSQSLSSCIHRLP